MEAFLEEAKASNRVLSTLSGAEKKQNTQSNGNGFTHRR